MKMVEGLHKDLLVHSGLDPVHSAFSSCPVRSVDGNLSAYILRYVSLREGTILLANHGKAFPERSD